jgi:NAD(P)-dependent dehydrogenase (short-subunit alcohol dehydrogenase family)
MASERIVIVGGTSGIGLGVSKLFAGRGAEVILGSRHQTGYLGHEPKSAIARDQCG